MTWKKLLHISLIQNQIWIALGCSCALIVILILVFKTSLFREQFNLQQSSSEKNQLQSIQSMDSQMIESTHSLSNSITIENEDVQSAQDNLCIQIYEKLAQDPEQILDLDTWTSYAKKTLEQSYLPLAGYLLDHVPPGSKQSNFEFQLYEFELCVFCQKQSDDSLRWLLLNIADQPQWDQHFSRLLECLFVNQIVVEQALIEPYDSTIRSTSSISEYALCSFVELHFIFAKPTSIDLANSRCSRK